LAEVNIANKIKDLQDQSTKVLMRLRMALIASDGNDRLRHAANCDSEFEKKLAVSCFVS